MVALRAKKSITLVFSLVFACACVLMGGVTLVAGLGAITLFHDKSITEGRQLIEDSVLSQLFLDSELVAQTLVGNVRDPLYQYDLSRIRAVLREVSKSDFVKYIYLVDPDGKIVHDGSRGIELYGLAVSELIPNKVIASGEKAFLFDGVLHRRERILAGQTPIGELYFGMTDAEAREKARYYGELLAKEQKQNEIELFTALLVGFAVLLLVSLPLVYLASRKMLKPLYELVSRSNDYTSGRDQVSFDLGRDDEFGVLGRALENMVEELDQSHQQVWRLAYQDTLTELPNRRQFHEKLDEIIEEASFKSQKFAMFFVDLDFFKQVNDACGHDVGDKLLRTIAKRLVSALDTHLTFHSEVKTQGKLVSRISGDEFVLILPIAKIADAKEFADRLYERFSVPIELEGRRFIQTVSIGITYFPYQAATAKKLMKNADIAMYQAKNMGRSTYCEFNEVLKSDFQRRSLIKQTASAAFENGQFFIEYQPICHIRDGSISGAEALIRWAHPELGRLWPSSFVNVLDENGLTTRLSLWMLEQIFQSYECQQLPSEGFKISINITSRVFLDGEFTRQMLTLVEKYRIPSGVLCIELTETDLTKNAERCRYYTHLWLEAGVLLWIDDFGGASSSLTFLNELPVDALKMSGPLVRDLELGTVRPVVEAIQSLASALDIDVIASGVESQSQLALMKELGCEFGQGFCLGPPVPITQLPSMLVGVKRAAAE